ncbi:MAG: homoserine dehydrogenase [Candidatus Aminicenantes bacterium RBG_16_63_16]|nr:MAG: homoserine dehydrogenase [Candidatus Aminicenantes bacterium RBG_16_63_16]
MEIKIALIGCGTVGRGLLEILETKRGQLKSAFDFDPKVVAISDLKKGSILVPDGIELDKLFALLDGGGRIDQYYGEGNTAELLNPLDMIEQCDADIIAELTYTDIQTGEPATGYIKKALRSGMHVVTSNKGPAALHYKELSGLAKKNGLVFGIEGTVMSGTPVFSLAAAGLAGNEIREVKGILNGTTNFILTKMEQDNMAYADALKLAQQLGYAEADPTADVEGFDALAKIVILSNVLLGAEITPADVKRQGITALTGEQIQAAKAQGFRYKLIAQAQRKGPKVVASVVPQKLPLADPLAGVMGAQNALTFDTDLLGKVTIQGPGAGKLETGCAILADILSIHSRFTGRRPGSASNA